MARRTREANAETYTEILETPGVGFHGSLIQVERVPARPASAFAHRVLRTKWLNARRLGCPSLRATISLCCGRSTPVVNCLLYEKGFEMLKINSGDAGSRTRVLSSSNAASTRLVCK